jgi:hypothetical protein
MRNVPRRSPRVTCSLPVRWTRWRQQLTGEVRQCNVHGMFIVTDHDAPLGFMMDLTIELPTGPISCTAIPKFCGEAANGKGIGVELHVMDSGDRDMWHTYYRRARSEQK